MMQRQPNRSELRSVVTSGLQTALKYQPYKRTYIFFKDGVKNTQAAAYNGARTVFGILA